MIKPNLWLENIETSTFVSIQNTNVSQFAYRRRWTIFRQYHQSDPDI
jgi:hypothetical protein